MTDEELICYLDSLPEDTFVLHGAKDQHDILVPAYANQPTLKEKRYNLTALYGTLVTDIALLYAVIHEDRSQWGWYFSDEAPHLRVRGPRRLNGGVGYVHILKRSDFSLVIEPGFVCLAFSLATPREVLRVQPTVLEFLRKQGRLCFE